MKKVKLGKVIERVTKKVKDYCSSEINLTAYGVTNTDGIVITGKKTSEDLNNYIPFFEDYFVYNPYRVNVGSIGLSKNKTGIVSPAYIVFKVNTNILPDFLFHFLKSSFGNEQINFYGNVGSVREALRYEDLLKIEIPFLTIEEQKKALADIQSNKTKIQALQTLLASQLELIKKYKQAILQDAIQGKLVPQDKQDEPASVLLEKIKKTKPQGTREKKLEPIKPEEIPFEIPKNWTWCRLGEVCEVSSGVTLGKELKGDDLVDVPYLRVANVQRGYFNLCEIKTIKVKKKDLEKYLLKKDDLLMTEGGDADKVGRCTVWKNEINNCIHQNHIFKIRANYLNIYWIQKCANSFLGRTYFFSAAKQTTNLASINMRQLNNFYFPLPPVEEQKRIVARVDQLMSYCDSIESKLMEDKQLSEHLVESILQEAFFN